MFSILNAYLFIKVIFLGTCLFSLLNIFIGAVTTNVANNTNVENVANVENVKNLEFVANVESKSQNFSESHRIDKGETKMASSGFLFFEIKSKFKLIIKSSPFYPFSFVLLSGR
jgi:hypothetical protein